MCLEFRIKNAFGILDFIIIIIIILPLNVHDSEFCSVSPCERVSSMFHVCFLSPVDSGGTSEVMLAGYCGEGERKLPAGMPV